MEYDWTEYLSDSSDETNIPSKYEAEGPKPEVPQEGSLKQNAAGCFSTVDWEHLTDPENDVEKHNTASDYQQEIFPSEELDEPEELNVSEEESTKPKVARAIRKSMFSWGSSNICERQAKRQNKRIKLAENKTKRSDELANQNSIKSREIPVIEIDDNDYPVKEAKSHEMESSEKLAMHEVTGKTRAVPMTEIDDDIVVAEPEQPKVYQQHTITIQGIKVMMPVKPYQCQVQVITSIISGCNKEENCLLESPTGSGKTLALLCGALAWQSDFQRKFDEAKWFEKTHQEAGTSEFPRPEKGGCKQSAGRCCDVDELDLDMFDASDWGEHDLSDYSKRSASKRVPKIYYCSRTHRQLSQVVKELKKTVYRDKRMTVLSSREFSCIQETNRNKNELCAELLDHTKKGGCPYYNDHNKNTLGSYNGLSQNGVESPWDIEDLVTAGRETGACPYFAARSLMVDAEIIFCPYNYLIDPSIRDTLQLDVRGHIIILDEAHNMEDICRDSGSISLTITMLESIVNDCINVLEFSTAKKVIHLGAYAAMIETWCQNLKRFIDFTKLNSKINAYDTASSKQWTSSELIGLFQMNQLNQETTSNFMRAIRDAISLFNSTKEELRQGRSTSLPTLTAESIRKLEMILMGLNMITSSQYAVDYRAVIKEITVGYKKERSLELLCMNPGVIFSPLSAMARTIILASGTLAPTSSFAGELGVKFPFTIQANHVTPRNQICVKCVGKGPNGNPLKATYSNVQTWDFQDGVGSIVASVCETVPHGILVFFSSYRAMETLVTRWQSKNVMNKIALTKSIFQETQGSAELNSMMKNYREAIRNTSNGLVGNINGAVLFAVIRGKVAEGIDFSDDEARAVLTIGIPFSARSDPAVDMKYQYNDANKSKGLSSGNDWYTIQAFRALNQALGRAIRHKNDWGAIILIDERLTECRYVNCLPAWIRSVFTPTGPQSDIVDCLKEFVARQKKRKNEP